MTLIIRPAVAADRDEIATMLGEVVAYFESIAEGSFDERPTPEALWECSGLGFAADPVCATLIPEIDGRIVGYLAYHFGVWEVFGALIVAGIYVRTQAQRQGIGRALMEEAGELARKRGVTHIAWEVWRQNPRAIRFYESIGAKAHDDNLRMVVTVDRPGCASRLSDT